MIKSEIKFDKVVILFNLALKFVESSRCRIYEEKLSSSNCVRLKWDYSISYKILLLSSSLKALFLLLKLNCFLISIV